MPEIVCQAQLCSSLAGCKDRSDARTMPALLESTIDFLEVELVKAKAALEHLRSAAELSDIQTCGEASVKAIAVYRRQLASRLLGHTKAENMTPQLLRLVSNSVIIDRLAPYLSLSDLFSLASTNSDIRHATLNNPRVFRHLDLTPCGASVKGNFTSNIANTSPLEPAKSHLVRKPDFSGPLKNLFRLLDRRAVLRSVRTLVLDGLPVSADLVEEMLSKSELSFTILSLRDNRNLDNDRLKQVLRHACRTDRPPGTPKVKGIYLFTTVDKNQGLHRPEERRKLESHQVCTHSMTIDGTGTERDGKSSMSDLHDWYRPSGRVLQRSKTDGWEKVLEECQGVISFDAVLCRSRRHNPNYNDVDASSSPLEPVLPHAIASIALGPKGCESCGSSPEGPLIWGESPESQFPLLSPLDIHNSTIAAAKSPGIPSSRGSRLIMQCEQCLANRHCHRCGRWWCFNCLPSPQNPTREIVFNQEDSSLGLPNNEETRKVVSGASRDCWECGPTCYDCKLAVNRKCVKCPNKFCFEHHESPATSLCDWCASASGRITAE